MSKRLSKRLLGLDVFAWAAGIGLAGAICYQFDFARIEAWRVLLLAGVAALLQAAAGLVHGLYTDCRCYQGFLNEVGSVAQTVAATAAILVVFNLWITPQLAPLGVIIAGALLALVPIGSARSLHAFNANARKRWRIGKPSRIPLDQALTVAEEIISDLDADDGVLRCSYVGSLRRMRETVGDIDLVAASERPTDVLDAFLSLRQANRVLKNRRPGTTKVAIVNPEGIQIELTVVPPSAYAAALVSQSGTKSHNKKVRKLALWRGYRFAWKPRHVFEYWLYQLTTGSPASAKREETEEDIYRRLGMQWIPPTLREDRGEIEAARNGDLPCLVELTDIRGDLHYSSWPDELDIRDTVLAAAKRGYDYCAITAHTGLILKEAQQLTSITRQREEFRALHASLERHTEVFHVGELEVDRYGEIDCPEEMLNTFDFLIATIHNDTHNWHAHRLLKAIEHPRVSIIGHRALCGIGKQEFYEVCRAASRHQVALEISARPNGPALPEEYVRRAKDYGVRFIISTNARSPNELILMRFGIAKAQRGWVTAEDVINTWPLKRLKQFIAKVDSNRVTASTSKSVARISSLSDTRC